MRHWINLIESVSRSVPITELSRTEKYDILTFLLNNCPPFEKYWMAEHGVMSFNETYVAQFIFGGELDGSGEYDFAAEDSIKIDYYPEFPLAEINNSRRSVSDNVVAKYAQMRGDTTPPVFVRREDKDWIVAEGGHRIAAAKMRGDETIRAYDLSVFFTLQWDALD